MDRRRGIPSFCHGAGPLSRRKAVACTAALSALQPRNGSQITFASGHSPRCLAFTRGRRRRAADGGRPRARRGRPSSSQLSPAVAIVAVYRARLPDGTRAALAAGQRGASGLPPTQNGGTLKGQRRGNVGCRPRPVGGGPASEAAAEAGGAPETKTSRKWLPRPRAGG